MPQTDAPAWEDTEEIPSWDETRPLLSDSEMGQIATNPPMQFLPGGMNEPGTREEKLQEAGAILGGAITAPGRAIEAVLPRWASEPLVNPQTTSSDLAFRRAHPVIGGVESAVVNLAKSFTSPIGIATLGMGALPGAAQRAVSLAFAGQMASSFPQLTDQIVQTYQQPDSPERTQELTRLFTEAAGTGAFTALATKHGLTPSEPILNRDQAMANRIAVRLSMPERLAISPQEQARLGLAVPESAPPRFEDTMLIPEGGEMPQIPAVQFPVQEIKPTEVSNASSIEPTTEMGLRGQGQEVGGGAPLRQQGTAANLPPQEGTVGRGGAGQAPEEKAPDLSKEASNVEKGAEIEKQDHRIARENPEIAREIAQEEIDLDPNAYKGDEVKSVKPPPENRVKTGETEGGGEGKVGGVYERNVQRDIAPNRPTVPLPEDMGVGTVRGAIETINPRTGAGGLPAVPENYGQPGTASQKSPWEITKAEAIELAASVPRLLKERNRAAAKAFQDKSDPAYKAAEKAFNQAREIAIEKLGIKGQNYNQGRGLDSQQLAERLSQKQAEDYHRQVIEDALKKGRHVPQNVIADYPDLAKKYGLSTTPPATSAGVETKQPWQMTKWEWVSQKPNSEIPSYAFGNEFHPAFEWTEGGKAHQVPMNEMARVHEYSVAQAVREGKSVPPEVIAEYPDLRQPSTQSQGPGTTAGEKPTTQVVGEQKPPPSPVKPGGGLSTRTAEEQAKSKANNSLKAMAEANGVTFVEGDTPESLMAKINAKAEREVSAKDLTPAQRATAEGQKKMASEAASVATVLNLNRRVRERSPSEAWDEKQIQAATGNQAMLNSIRDDLLPIYNRLYAKSAPEPPPSPAGAGEIINPNEITPSKANESLESVPKRIPGTVSTPEETKAWMSAIRHTYGDGTPEARRAINQLKEFAKSGKYFEATSRKLGDIVRALGVTISHKSGDTSLASLGANKIRVAHQTSLFHELGHVLLLQKSGQIPWEKQLGSIGGELKGEWKALHDSEWADVAREKWDYWTQQTERYASLLNLYVKHNARFKKLAPNLYSKLETLLDESAPTVSLFKEAQSKGESPFTVLSDKLKQPTPPPSEPPSGGEGDVAERWILNAQKQAAKTHFGKSSPDAALKVVSEWIREGETPNGPIPKGVQDALMRSLKATKDLETGETLGPGDADWPRTGTLLDFLESRSQDRMPGNISEGPGAASPGDVPLKSQIEQLGSAFKGGSTQRQTLTEKLKEIFDLTKQREISKDLLSRTLSALKTSGNYLIDTWKGQNELDPILKSKGILSAELEKRGWRMRQAMKDMKRAVPDLRVREAISKYVDAGGDMEKLRTAAETVPPARRAPYIRAMQLTPEEKIFAGHVQSYFESRLQEAIDAGVLREGIEDYMHRIYPRETDWKRGVVNAIQNGVLDTRKPGLAMKRVFDLDSEAEKAGYHPVNDFIPRILDYEASLSKVIASREAVKRFTEIKMPDGRPMLDVAGVGIPVENAEGVREATLIKPSFKPGEKQLGDDGKPTKNYRQDYQSRDYHALKKWKWAATDSDGQPIMVEGNVLIHPDAVHRIDALLSPSTVRKYAAGRAALNVGSVFKQTMLDFSGFHQVQIAVHGLEHRVNPFNLVKEINFEDPRVDGLLRGGITLGGEHVTGMAEEGLVGRSLSRQVPGLGPLMQTYHQWLFQDFIPRVKMTMALHALERNKKAFAKDLASGKMSEDALYYQTAKEANAAFGGLNYIMLERSKSIQDLARLTFLAPDFLEARGRFVGQALTRLGAEQRAALFLGAVTMYAIARVMNKALDDQYHFEPDNAFSVVYKGKAYSLRTVQGDILHALEEPVRFWLHRLNPTITRPAFELMTGRDEFGRKRDFWQVMGDTISNIIPISMRNSREQKWWVAMLNAFGGSVRRYNEVHAVAQEAQDWKRKNNIRSEPGEFIYDPSKDIYRPLKLALMDGDRSGAEVEYRKLVASNQVTPEQIWNHFKLYANSNFTGSKTNEDKFVASLTKDQHQSWLAAKQEKQRVFDEFKKFAPPPNQNNLPRVPQLPRLPATPYFPTMQPSTNSITR